jgi:glucodextranase-like protein/PASTA domain-containing protein
VRRSPAAVPRPLAVALSAVALVALAAVAAGCGAGGDGGAASSRPVRLAITAPLDTGTTRSPTTTVSGTVSPSSAQVLVMGKSVGVSGGRFSTTVDLREGANVVDVGASAAGAAPVWRAVRVTRASEIAVPDVVGLTADDGRSRVAAAGLDAQVDDRGGLLDAFRDGPKRVCGTDPDTGTKLTPGSTVTLIVAKAC